MAYLGRDPRGHPPRPPPPLARNGRFGRPDAYQLVRMYRWSRMHGDFAKAAAILAELVELASRPRCRTRGRDDRGEP